MSGLSMFNNKFNQILTLKILNFDLIFYLKILSQKEAKHVQMNNNGEKFFLFSFR